MAPIPGDGYCMLESMRYSLEQDYDEKMSKEEFREKIKDDLYEGIVNYAQAHVGGIRKCLEECRKVLCTW